MTNHGSGCAKTPVIVVESSDSSAAESGHECAQLLRSKRQRNALSARRSHLAGTACGLSSREYRRLKRWHLPQLMFQIFALICGRWGYLDQHYDGAEWFCGIGMVELAFVLASLNAFGYDINRHMDDGRGNPNFMDFTTPWGFFFGCFKTQGMRVRALSHWDTVCSSWVWMSQKHCQRSVIDPEGNAACASVNAGNLMVVRMVLLAMCQLARDGIWLLEQPMTSLMRQHRRFVWLQRAVIDVQKKLEATQLLHGPGSSSEVFDWDGWNKGIVDMPTAMGCFGGDTDKRTMLSSSHPQILLPLHRVMSKEDRGRLALVNKSLVTQRICVEDNRMKVKVTGKKAVLKGSQAYPQHYGSAVCASYQKWLASQPPMDFGESSESDYSDTSSDWSDADLLPVARLLSSSGAPRVF